MFCFMIIFLVFSVVSVFIFVGKKCFTKDIIIFHYQDHRNHPIIMFSLKRQLEKKKKQKKTKTDRKQHQKEGL